MTQANDNLSTSSRNVLDLFHDLYTGKLTPEKAFQRFKYLPYEDLGFAKADIHRHFRTGLSEVIFCEGKSSNQVISIGKKLLDAHGYFAATRVPPQIGAALTGAFEKVDYSEETRLAVVGNIPPGQLQPGISLLTAGTSDIPVAEEAVLAARLMGQDVKKIYDVGVAGIHRILDHRQKIEQANVLIVIAGMEGALPSLTAGLFGKPIIAVPTSIGYGSSFHGLSALLAMLNSCSFGIAVVNIDNGFGAGYLASMINRLSIPGQGQT